MMLGLCAPHGGTSRAAAQLVVNGGGATSAVSLLKQWFLDFSKVDPSAHFNYQAVGSGKGQKLIADQLADFAVSDAPMSNEALANAPGKILHVPIVGAANVIIFNLHGVKELRLDGPTLAAIYLGKITEWNDPAIVRQNPGVKMPEVRITVAHRSDGSGSTYILTDYLCDLSPEWKSKVGRYMSVNWPVGVGFAGNGAMSSYVQKTPGAIGYVDLIFAIQNQLTQASMKNAAGVYTKASTESITAAINTAKVPDDMRLSIVNAPGAGSYPIAGVIWVLVYEKPQDVARSEKLAAFLKWADTDGQKTARELNFAPLPDNLRRRVLGVIGSIAIHP
jgi:phosphate transport system substrate-binding protein